MSAIYRTVWAFLPVKIDPFFSKTLEPKVSFGSRWFGFGLRSLPFWISVSFLGFWVCALLFTSSQFTKQRKSNPTSKTFRCLLLYLMKPGALRRRSRYAATAGIGAEAQDGLNQKIKNHSPEWAHRYNRFSFSFLFMIARCNLVRPKVIAST